METRHIEFGPSYVSPVSLSIDGRTALLIVDMQKTLVSKGQGFGLAMDRAFPGIGNDRQARIDNLVIPTIQKLLGYFRNLGLPVIYLKVASHHADYRDFPAPFRESHQALELESGVAGTLWVGDPSSEIHQDIEPALGEIIIEKRSFGAFSTSNIDEVLGQRGIDCLVITGVGTSACVDLTARGAADRGYRCVIVEEGVAGYDMGAHEASLRGFHADFGRVARTADAVISAMENGQPV